MFAVNYLSHFILTRLLTDKLVASRPSRVVNVASDAIRQRASIDFDDLQSKRRFGSIRAYKQSKLALVLFTTELARRLAGSTVVVNAVHPGDVRTNMTARGFFIDLIRPLLPSISAEAAARGCADLALSPDHAHTSGAYFEGGRSVDPGPAARDEAAAKKLWDLSDALGGTATRALVAAMPGTARAARG
jgi:retinol dehydrogenase-13